MAQNDPWPQKPPASESCGYMIAALIFLAVVVAIAGWWLSLPAAVLQARGLRREIRALPPSTEAIKLPASKVGLGVFLAVVGALFALFFSAYFMRMELPDWRTLTDAAHPVVQHRRADAQQRRVAACRRGRAAQPADRRLKPISDGRGCRRRCLSRRAGACLACAGRSRAISPRQTRPTASLFLCSPACTDCT